MPTAVAGPPSPTVVRAAVAGRPAARVLRSRLRRALLCTALAWRYVLSEVSGARMGSGNAGLESAMTPVRLVCISGRLGAKTVNLTAARVVLGMRQGSGEGPGHRQTPCHPLPCYA